MLTYNNCVVQVCYLSKLKRKLYNVSVNMCTYVCHQTLFHFVSSCGDTVSQWGGGGCVVSDGLLKGKDKFNTKENMIHKLGRV